MEWQQGSTENHTPPRWKAQVFWAGKEALQDVVSWKSTGKEGIWLVATDNNTQTHPRRPWRGIWVSSQCTPWLVQCLSYKEQLSSRNRSNKEWSSLLWRNVSRVSEVACRSQKAFVEELVPNRVKYAIADCPLLHTGSTLTRHLWPWIHSTRRTVILGRSMSGWGHPSQEMISMRWQYSCVCACQTMRSNQSQSLSSEGKVFASQARSVASRINVCKMLFNPRHGRIGSLPLACQWSVPWLCQKKKRRMSCSLTTWTPRHAPMLQRLTKPSPTPRSASSRPTVPTWFSQLMQVR